jgi:hypothetical protein
MPVEAGHEQQWTTTDAAPGGGTFGSEGLYACWALARRLVRQVTRQPWSTAAQVCGEHRRRMETQSVGGGAVGFRLERWRRYAGQTNRRVSHCFAPQWLCLGAVAMQRR